MEQRQQPSGMTLAYLQELSSHCPTIDSALSERAMLKIKLEARRGTIHVLSDVHGEFHKLRHVIGNVSGALKPLVDQLFGINTSEAELTKLLHFLYYPLEAYRHYAPNGSCEPESRALISKTIEREIELVRYLSKARSLDAVATHLPDAWRNPLVELLFGPVESRSRVLTTLLDTLFTFNRDKAFLRLLARSIRNLLVEELIVAGDLGDRGPRIDKVIEYLKRQPRVKIIWGNHDMSWLGACLGHLACIATVVRMSVRHGRTTQLEEGYGIPLAPLEQLARSTYAGDAATAFRCKGVDPRGEELLAQMQKAIAIIQFKLESDVVRRNPQFKLDQRNLLGAIDHTENTVTVDGVSYPLADSNLPTVDPESPSALSEAELACMESLRSAFLDSRPLWDHMTYMVQSGAMFLVRDETLLFHACIPVDDNGDFLPFSIDGIARHGRGLMEAFESVVRRTLFEPKEHDLDLLWYLWGGPLSPCFGKDKLATFESYFVSDKKARHETKNPYFKLIQEKNFCQKILREFGVSPSTGLIVNGHVPVKIDEGESPVKKSGQAITIDGAFSEAYGDKGYTLVLAPERTLIAQHTHVNSVEAMLNAGQNIVPSIKILVTHERPQTVAESTEGAAIAARVEALEMLVQAYRENVIAEQI